MAKRLFKVILDVEFPSGMADDESPPSPGFPGRATAAGEAVKILRDGCGASFTYRNISRQGPIRSQTDVFISIEEV